MERKNELLGLVVHRPFTLELADGQEHELTPLTVSRMLEAEKLWLPLTDEAEKGRVFLWAIVWQALLPKAPELTFEQVGELIPAYWMQLGAEELRDLLEALGVQADVRKEKVADPLAGTSGSPQP